MTPNLKHISVRLTEDHLEWLDSDSVPYTGSRSERIRFVLSLMKKTLESMDPSVLQFMASKASIQKKADLTARIAEYAPTIEEIREILQWYSDFEKDLKQLEDAIQPFVILLKKHENEPKTKELFAQLFGHPRQRE